MLQIHLRTNQFNFCKNFKTNLSTNRISLNFRMKTNSSNNKWLITTSSNLILNNSKKSSMLLKSNLQSHLNLISWLLTNKSRLTLWTKRLRLLRPLMKILKKKQTKLEKRKNELNLSQMPRNIRLKSWRKRSSHLNNRLVITWSQMLRWINWKQQFEISKLK